MKYVHMVCCPDGAINKCKRTFSQYRAARALIELVPFKGAVALDEDAGLICANQAVRTAMDPATGDDGRESWDTFLEKIRPDCLKLKAGAPDSPRRTKILTDTKTPLGIKDVELRIIQDDHNCTLFLVLFDRYPIQDAWYSVLKAGQISNRELDVIYCVLDGLSNKEIAKALYISKFTVENHLKSIYRKLKVKSRTHLLYSLLKSDWR